MKKRSVVWIACVLVCLMAGSALAEAGWVETGNGPLNMRKKASAKSDIVMRVPNRAWIETVETDGDWTRIAYKGKEGYVKTEYLRLVSQLVGQTVYLDEGYVYLRAQMDDAAQSVTAVHPAQPMTILEIADGWAYVSCDDPYLGGVEGYISLEAISEWREAPADGALAEYHAHLSLAQEELPLGGVAEITLLAEEGADKKLSLYKDGKVVFEDLPVPYETVCYRMRESGEYRMEAIVTDPETGNMIGCQAYFTVTQEMEQAEGFTLYSQKDGWWLDKKYGRSNLDQSGCAIFTLSHALALLGMDSADSKPEALAEKYSAYLTESGTVTENLLAAAGRAFGFSTGKDKIKDKAVIAQRFEEGAVFSFSVADGHIALAAGMSEDGAMVKIIDSAPSATFERIENASPYYVDDDGKFQAAQTLMDIPGAKYYLDTQDFGGLEYYLELSYVARRGVRMIRLK